MSPKMSSTILSRSSVHRIPSSFRPHCFLRAEPSCWEVLDKSLKNYTREGGAVYQSPDSAGGYGQSRHTDIFGFHFQGALRGSLVTQGPLSPQVVGLVPETPGIPSPTYAGTLATAKPKAGLAVPREPQSTAHRRRRAPLAVVWTPVTRPRPRLGGNPIHPGAPGCIYWSLSFSLGFRAIEEMRRRLDGFQSAPLTTQDAARILRKPLRPVTPSSLVQADS